jgi:hypothetical protein
LIQGVKFTSFLEPSGYGLAAIGYVRALVNAGVPVQWRLVRHAGWGFAPVAAGETLPFLDQSVGDAALADLPALLAATARPIAFDTTLVHTVPEHWPGLFEPGRRNFGYAAWETSRPPQHWRTLLDSAAGVLVPSEANRAAFVAAGVRAPVRTVPHVRRHAWNAFAPDELERAREQFGVAAAQTIFYSINAWDPRKALPALLRAFVHAFTAGDRVALIVKTGPVGYGPPPFYPKGPSAEFAQAAIDAAAAETGRDPPSICLLPYELSGRGIDLLHALGDACVSLSHGEGWALGAFDAATQAIPVLMTGWGGQLDYLGVNWPGALPFRMAQVPVWPPERPSYWPSQRWAEVDQDAAVRALRAFVADPAPHLAAAEVTAERIANLYAEPVIASTLLDAIDG